ncbi:MAG TPA: hypothetical protein V6D47_14200 [Oscillatoriaceae cyanobacterium]
MPRPSVYAGAIALSLTCLTGCDLLVAGRFMPALGPLIGNPITGLVLDADTRLPVGGATVTSGLGSTLTDPSGHFTLYGDLNAHQISVSRAGYMANTVGGGLYDPSHALQLTISRAFANEATLPSRFIDMRGQLVNTAGQVLPTGIVSYAGQTPQPVAANGQYEIKFGAKWPGSLLTAVLAGGQTSAPYADVTGAQPFTYLSFGYRLESAKMGATYTDPAAQDQPTPLTVGNVHLVPVSVRYTNLFPSARVETDVLLDFGVAGSVPVARAFGSNQTIQVPQVNGLKYDIIGTATDATGQQHSTVQITTNDPSKAPFTMLSIPKIESPTPGETGTGPRPTFSWSPSAVQGVTYEVTLFEGDKGSTDPPTKKWVADTTETSIDYPGFSAGDVNGGALIAQKVYTWQLRVVDVLGATQTPSDLPPVQPYRLRQREAPVVGSSFSI